VRRKIPINETGYYHVGARGTYGRPIFRNDNDHELFLTLYQRTAEKYRWKTLAWALMWNHHHFLVRLTDGGLSSGMRALHSNYSRRLNVIDGETNMGHLVRHCFFADEATTTDSVLARAAYIDLNPVRAGLCHRPEQWRWSSYRATLGLAYPLGFHEPAELLSLVDGDPRRARRTYREFILRTLAEDDTVLCSEQGVTSVTRQRVVESAA
jgi:REP element-mobilizing transposase RayT